MCALFAKIVALLAKQFAKRTGCDRRRLWQIDRWIKKITLTMSIGVDGRLAARWTPKATDTILRPDAVRFYNVGYQQAHPLDGWLLIGLHWLANNSANGRARQIPISIGGFYDQFHLPACRHGCLRRVLSAGSVRQRVALLKPRPVVAPPGHSSEAEEFLTTGHAGRRQK